MPASGPLFTAQSAQLRVFIAAVVACKAEHRTLIRNWFEELVDGTRGVSHFFPVTLMWLIAVNAECASCVASGPIYVGMA